MNRAHNPLIIQGDGTVLLEVDNDLYSDARDFLARFAELEKSPQYMHTYRIHPLSLWNAAAAGMDTSAILTGLEQFAKYPVPDNVRRDVAEYMLRYGRLKLIWYDSRELHLLSDDELLITEVSRHKKLQPFVEARLDPTTLRMNPARRGYIKQALVQIGYPAEDLAGYRDGARLPFELEDRAVGTGDPFQLRDYQATAADIFHADGAAAGGSGVIVLPCGAGKTIVGMAVMDKLKTNTLILTPSIVAARQWRDELLDKTTLTADDIGEYTGLRKEIRPVTISTYQTMTYRTRGSKGRPINEQHPHFKLFNERDWGLIIYDEVHLLPAPVFSITAELQSRRRLGLTATLVREDGRETDVFSLIGPKRYDVPWRDLEAQGWIATAVVHEVRVPLPHAVRLQYALADRREQHRIAMENPEKLSVLSELLAKHAGDRILVIGMYLSQLQAVHDRYGYPMITGETKVSEREALFARFREGAISGLIVSKVGNFSIDLPDANVMIQLSGTFGSRQEEAQRLGRILRPNSDGSMAHFYALTSRDTSDQEFAANRQRFLTEQGYRYHILYPDELPAFEPHAAPPRT